MKKILLGTTALIAMGLVSGQANAADKISLGLGGFMNQYVAYSDNDATATTANPDAQNDAISQYGDTEIYVSGSTTLDNGLTVKAMVQREGDKGNSGNDVSNLTISSDGFGQLLLGSDVGAAKKLGNKAPNVGPLGITDVDAFGVSTSIVNGTTSSEADGDKSAKLRYISPSFSGVSVAISHAPDQDSANSEVVATDGDSQTQFAVAYSGEVSGMGVELDLGRVQSQGSAAQKTRGGLVVSMGGFSVGGSYAAMSDDDEGNATTDDSLDGNAWDLGVGYATGPYSFAVTYAESEIDATSADTDSDEATIWKVGGSYDMGAGVSLVGQYAKGKYQNEENSLVSGNNPSVFLAGIEVSF